MTTGVDLVVVAYQALAAEEQADAYARISELRVKEAAGEESAMARNIRSLQRVAEELGEFPTFDLYKEVSAKLISAGEDIETPSRLYRGFGSWQRAREAFDLSATTTAKRIEARFRSRRVGKVWRFTTDTLRDVLLLAAEHWGRPPSVAEFEHWRDRELELAAAAGDDSLQLPSPSPYRRRYGTWEAALLHFGFTPEEVAQRLEGKRFNPAEHFQPDTGLPDDIPVAELRTLTTAVEFGLDPAALNRLRDAWQTMPRRSRYVLTVRLGLGGSEQRTLQAAGKPLGLGASRIGQLQELAVSELCRAVAHDKFADTELVREPVLTALARLAVIRS